MVFLRITRPIALIPSQVVFCRAIFISIFFYKQLNYVILVRRGKQVNNYIDIQIKNRENNTDRNLVIVAKFDRISLILY